MKGLLLLCVCVCCGPGLPSLLVSVLWTDCCASATANASSSPDSKASDKSKRTHALTLPNTESITLSEECLVTTLLIVKTLNNVARLDLKLLQVSTVL